MAQVRLAFWFDAEDYTSPYEPVCLARLAGVFARRGLRATWKLVGEEARMLRRAAAGDSPGRDAAAAREALRAIGGQDLGFHTDWHSLHPTVAEYCTGAGWEDGQERFDRTEGPGLQALRAAFPGRPVLCYGQAGASWAPQAYPVLRRWGIPLYLDEAGHVGCAEQPFFYGGVLNVLRLRHFCVRRRGHRPPGEGAPEAAADLGRIATALAARGGGMAQCWWHPNELYTDQWWDGLNFGAGVNAITPAVDGAAAYRVPEPVPPEERERRFASLEAFVDAAARRPDVRICGAAEIVAAYPDRARGRRFAPEELRRVAEALADGLTHQRHGDVTLSAAEAAYLLARALAGPVPADGVPLETSPDGPSSRAQADLPDAAPLEEVRLAAAACVEAVHRTGRLPDALPLAGGTADPPSLAAAFALAHLETEHPRPGAGGRIPLARPRLAAEDYIRGEGVWGWSIFAPGFNPTDLIELARLQAWTLKPALLAR